MAAVAASAARGTAFMACRRRGAGEPGDRGMLFLLGGWFGGVEGVEVVFDAVFDIFGDVLALDEGFELFFERAFLGFAAAAADAGAVVCGFDLGEARAGALLALELGSVAVVGEFFGAFAAGFDGTDAGFLAAWGGEGGHGEALHEALALTGFFAHAEELHFGVALHAHFAEFLAELVETFAELVFGGFEFVELGGIELTGFFGGFGFFHLLVVLVGFHFELFEFFAEFLFLGCLGDLGLLTVLFVFAAVLAVFGLIVFLGAGGGGHAFGGGLQFGGFLAFLGGLFAFLFLREHFGEVFGGLFELLVLEFLGEFAGLRVLFFFEFLAGLLHELGLFFLFEGLGGLVHFALEFGELLHGFGDVLGGLEFLDVLFEVVGVEFLEFLFVGGFFEFLDEFFEFLFDLVHAVAGHFFAGEAVEDGLVSGFEGGEACGEGEEAGAGGEFAGPREFEGGGVESGDGFGGGVGLKVEEATGFVFCLEAAVGDDGVAEVEGFVGAGGGFFGGRSADDGGDDGCGEG